MVGEHLGIGGPRFGPVAQPDSGERAERHGQRPAAAKTHDLAQHRPTAPADQTAMVSHGQRALGALDLDQQADDAGDPAVHHVVRQAIDLVDDGVDQGNQRSRPSSAKGPYYPMAAFKVW